MVQNDQYERAKELLSDYLNKTKEKEETPAIRYSFSDKIRMAIEVLLFGWIMPGRKKSKKDDL